MPILPLDLNLDELNAGKVIVEAGKVKAGVMLADTEKYWIPYDGVITLYTEVIDKIGDIVNKVNDIIAELEV